MQNDANPTAEAGADLSIEDRIESYLDNGTTQDDQVNPDNEPIEDVIEDTEQDSDSEVSETEEESTEGAEKQYDTEIDYLADKLGVESNRFHIDEDGRVKFTAKVDGEEMQVDFNELAKSYQLEKHINNKSQSISEAQRQFETQKQAQEQEILQKLQQADDFANFAKSQLNAEYNAIDWQALKDADPAQYSAMRLDFAEKANQLEQVSKAAEYERNQKLQEAQQQQMTQMQEYLATQSQMLVDKVPEWSDSSVKEQDIKELNSFLSTQYGFTEQDLAGVSDHRLVILARDAMRANKVKQATNQKAKKPVPKFQKPGTVTSKDTIDSKSKQAVKQFKKTGSSDDLMTVLLDRV